ncbi:signal peptidase I [Proteiniclasticum sp. SCR006]|uniref:Signal peptidase I n=1 Tax=Proteiniclasticum aestuarii TaxID=2817862 RepID=A0A939KJG3_9CLOT|nr:signal peptidase I [Proteiniclasticum aestuarii]MBO1265021.1 signal peptidase I [Proteiniclasticum aestuarii]
MIKKQSSNSITEAITERRKALYIRKGYISLLIRIALIAAVGYILFTQVFLITQARGNDMFPAIKDGDLIIAFRLQKELVKDDIVVYEVGDVTRLGRIVALENDEVLLDDSGVFRLNGTPQSGEIVFQTFPKDGYDYPLQVPEGRLFLLGDHRNQTKDSRDHGPVSFEDLKGKVITILRRRGL